MLVQGKPFRTIWFDQRYSDRFYIIDQRQLPHSLEIATIKDVDTAVQAIGEMWVRGAPLIGATAAWGMYLAASQIPARCDSQFWFEEAYSKLLRARPTAFNLKWALDRMLEVLRHARDPDEAALIARRMAAHITEEDVQINASIGEHGLNLIKDIYERVQRPVNILTHCNAGWLATVDWGTATAPIYKAKAEGIPVHVYVDETRPRNQGAALTTWELMNMDVPCTLITDNAGGHLMQKGKVDIVITGTDRVDRNGNVCNKIGTYLKALAAKHQGVPFYVALPTGTIDWSMDNAFKDLTIEERGEEEILFIQGKMKGKIAQVQIAPDGTKAENPAFDVTPADLVTGLITERGICAATFEGMSNLYPEIGQDER